MAGTGKNTNRNSSKRTTNKKGTGKTGTTRARNTANANNKTARNNTSSKKTNSKAKYIPDEHDIMIRKEVSLIIMFAFAVVLLLSNFGLCGSVGKWLSYFMFGCFGVYAYIFPILFVLGIAFLVSNSGNQKAKIKFFASTALFIFLCAFVQLIISHDKSSIGKYYIDCAKYKTGGGITGGVFMSIFTKTIGVVGAYVVIILLILAAMVIITDKSVIAPMKARGSRAYENAKNDVKRRKEINQEINEKKKEYQEIAKEEKLRKKKARTLNKFTGMRLGDTNLKSGEVNDIHEINADEVELPIIDESIFNKFEDKENAGDINYGNNDTGHEVFRMDPQLANSTVPGLDTPEEFSMPSFDIHKFEGVSNEIKSHEEEETHLDEDGMFKPKEQIFVSEEAKNTMARKPFSTEPVVKQPLPGSEKVAVHTDGDSTDIIAIPDQEVIDTPEKTVDRKPKMAAPPKKYVMPPLNLLAKPDNHTNSKAGQAELRDTAIKLQQTLQNFGVGVTITDVSRGPSVTRYELQPEQGTKVSKITSLSDDIKLNLAAADIRIEAPIPGKAAVGIEVPNPTRDTVYFRELIESQELKNHPSKIAFAAGKDIAGKVIVSDIAKMPHMLIAGTTGSGKSVFTNSIIMSILYRAKPSEVKLIIVDPKVVEFGVYNGIPHLMIPVVTDPKKAAGALNWAVAEMQDRYKKFAEQNVRDLKGYNKKITTMPANAELSPLPQIIIIIDELADLMMVAAKEVEEAICRLAQLARAAGIHLIIATQRPSVDVVTGLIKANIPSRVALLVSSGTDSRTIIDMNGAEKLLGNGDMLFYPSGYVKPVRLQGAFISDNEVSNVVSFIKQHSNEVTYDPSITNQLNAPTQTLGDDGEDSRDMYFADAAKFVVEREKASTSMLQRVFKIGFNRAARIMDQLEADGIVGSEVGTKPRKVLMSKEELEEFIENNL